MAKKHKSRKLTDEEFQAVKENQQRRVDAAFDTFADMLIDKIKNQKKSEWKRPWFAEGQLAWPKDIYGKSYHGINALMLTLLCEKEDYKIPVFATYEGIKNLNYKKKDKDSKPQRAVDKDGNPRPWVSVNKDEHSFPVFYSSFTAVMKKEFWNGRDKRNLTYREYANLPLEEQDKYDTYKVRKPYYVFNIDQSNLKESRPELYEKLRKANVQEPLDIPEGEVFSFAPLDLLIEHQQWICPIIVKELKAGDSPYYSPSEKNIVLGTKEQYAKGGRPESWVNDGFHEMAHSTGDADYLGRFKKSDESSADVQTVPAEEDASVQENLTNRQKRAREELVAEVSAALSCHRYGIPKTLDEDSVPYIDDWLDELGNNPEYIRTVLNDVKKATALIDMRIDRMRLEYLNEKDPDKLDIREDDDVDIDIDIDGDVVVSEHEVHGADKKQGENEGHDGHQQEPEERHRSAGMRR